MAVIQAECAINVVPSLVAIGDHYVIVTIAYGATLGSGSWISIDVDKRTVKVDGVDARADITGLFPQMYPGSNAMVYTDSEASRILAVMIRHKARY